MDWMFVVPQNSYGEAPPCNVTVFGDRDFMRWLRLNEILKVKPNLIELVSLY